MELDIYRALEAILGVFAIVAVSWLGSLAADLMINKRLGFSPEHAEFKRAHLYDINPVGVGSMLIASAAGILSYLGLFGPEAKSLAHFISLLLCFLLVPFIGWVTGGKYYLARRSHELIAICEPTTAGAPPRRHLECCICENDFETDDMSFCPAYQGPICSLCCSLDSRCLDTCKPQGKMANQMRHFFSLFLPRRISALVDTRIARFLAIFTCVNLLTAAVLSLIYYQMNPGDSAESALLRSALWTLFFTLMIVFGVISWLFLLAHESREVAQEESNRQTQRLIEEIEAHQITDQYLQEAKEKAERANSAKSRYLTGISHELRTPLQSVMGYAQLLQQRSGESADHQKGLKIIRRNAEYLNDLIEGLLDISKIEAGRLDLYRNKVKLPELLEQMVDMFRPQAEEKGIEFNVEITTSLPQLVVVDDKRLRQILINLWSNAIKYTEKGRVEFSISYRNQVAEFVVRDTGVGIAPHDIERVFEPFERVRNMQIPNVVGTGLGLTIVRLLTDIMGGELQIESELDKGSCFRVSLMLSRVDTPSMPIEEQRVIGYEGERKTVLVVDDEPVHRGLIADLLVPLGFVTLEAKDAEGCLEILQYHQPDLFLLDISMPGMTGLELAQLLRDKGYQQPIMMVSADADERHRSFNDSSAHDDYLVKPINNQLLLEKMGRLLDLDWRYEHLEQLSVPTSSTRLHFAAIQKPVSDGSWLDHELMRELRAYAELGFYKGVNSSLENIARMEILLPEQLLYFQQLAEQFRYDELVREIGGRQS